MSMLGGAPSFTDSVFPGRNLEMHFFELNEGLSVVRARIGEERYAKAIELSDKMRRLYEADPEDKSGASNAGSKLNWELSALLKSTPRKQ
ncbi:MAG: hypothetical protein AB7L26_15835 [Hyphomonadaceae bacterium]